MILSAHNRIAAGQALAADPGSYLLLFRCAGFEDQRFPVVVPRKREAPTTDGIFQVLQGLRRHRLLDKDGNVLRTFFDTLSPVAD